VLADLASVTYLRGDIDIATEAVDEILKELPDNIFALNQRGHIHSLRGNLKEAESDYNRVLKLSTDEGNDKDQAAALGNLGLIFDIRGELDKAEEFWEKAVELYKRIGMPHILEKVQGWIEGIETD